MNGTKSSPLGFVEQGAKSLTVQLLALIRQRRHHPEGKIRFALILIGNYNRKSNTLSCWVVSDVIS